MPKWLVVPVCCCAAQAAVIRGVVLDGATGRALARSLVTVRPVEGAGSKAQTARAGRTGQFSFTVSAGMYLLRASRSGFAPFQYGQRDWKAAGKPMSVEEDGALFLDIRLHRFGAISGTVFDENDVGISEQKVVAYLARQPLEIAASAMTDDRGVYRIHGLEPGTYYVRTVAKQLEDGSGLLPTFSKETLALDQCYPVDVDLDQQADEVNIRPLPGKLFRVHGVAATPVPLASPITVTLISDVGRVRTSTGGPFAFEQLAPGNYELIAEADDPRGHGKYGAYREMPLEKDTDVSVQLNYWHPTEFRMESGKGSRMDPATARITARRKDLDGGGRAEVLKLDDGHAALGLGRWEMSVSPPAGYYVAELSGTLDSPDAPRSRADGWNEVVLREFNVIGIKLAARPASIHGVVNGAGQEPAPGAPVYLEAFDPETGRRLADLRVTRTDVHGKYHFRDLAPGVYRILSTFEYEHPDAETMGAAGARSVTLSEATRTEQNLDLYAR